MREAGGGGGGRGVSWGGRGVQGGTSAPARGVSWGGRGGGKLTDSVAQAAEDVQAFATQRALELALEANGLVGPQAEDALVQELASTGRGAAGLGSPITEGPAARVLTPPRRLAGGMTNGDPAGALRAAGAAWQHGMAAGQASYVPHAMRSPRPTGRTYDELGGAPLGGPSALSRVGRPRRPTMADKTGGSGY